MFANKRQDQLLLICIPSLSKGSEYINSSDLLDVCVGSMYFPMIYIVFEERVRSVCCCLSVLCNFHNKRIANKNLHIKVKTGKNLNVALWLRNDFLASIGC